MAGKSLRYFVAFLALVAGIAGFEMYALFAHNRERAAAVPSAPAPARIAGPVGDIDAPAGEAIVGPRVTISGWALDPAGVRSVEIRLDGRAFAAKIGIARPDVAKVKPEITGNANGGFEFTGDFSAHPPPPGVDRRTLSIVAIAKDGREAVIGRRSLIDPAALSAGPNSRRVTRRRSTCCPRCRQSISTAPANSTRSTRLISRRRCARAFACRSCTCA